MEEKKGSKSAKRLKSMMPMFPNREYRRNKEREEKRRDKVKKRMLEERTIDLEDGMRYKFVNAGTDDFSCSKCNISAELCNQSDVIFTCSGGYYVQVSNE